MPQNCKFVNNHIITISIYKFIKNWFSITINYRTTDNGQYLCRNNIYGILVLLNTEELYKCQEAASLHVDVHILHKFAFKLGTGYIKGILYT